MSELLYGCTTLTNEIPGEKAEWEWHNDAPCSFELILKVAPY